MASGNGNLPWVADTHSLPNPSLQDIAGRAKVSRSTVSRVMRNDPRISPGTVERVRAAAKELNYRPNPLLSTLMERVRVGGDISYQGTLAIISDKEDATRWYVADNSSWARIHFGALQRAQERGYKVECFSTRDYPTGTRRLSQVLRARDIRGIYVAPGLRGRELQIEWEWFAAATTGYGLLQPMLHRVCYNNYHGIQLACQKLRAAGYQRLGLYLNHRSNAATDNNYLAGFLIFQQSLPEEDRIPAALVESYEREHFHRWFREHRPDALIGLQTKLPEWASELGVLCPNDVGFALLDHTPNLEAFAGVDHNNDILGRGVMDLILAQLHRGEFGIPDHPTTTVVEGRWAEGASVRKTDAAVAS
jgi:DNA-binding LacI/PurR family transcriptional regulator